MFPALKKIAYSLKHELVFYRLLIADPRTPKPAKALLWCAAAYALSPIDLIPDFIPIIGQCDDLIIVPLLILIATKSIPREIIEDNRKKAHLSLGLPASRQ